MKNSPISYSTIKRAKPVIGTYVEITASSIDISAVKYAVAEAFKRIIDLELIFSAHNKDSELSKLCNTAHKSPQKVSKELWTLLKTSVYFNQISEGIFDIVIPHIGVNFENISSKDIEFHADRNISFRKELKIDFGGIAKGYIVDKAVDVLIKHGVISGLVNAGGDMRAFGCDSHAVHIRDPQSPTKLPFAFNLSKRALACSGGYFSSDGVTTEIFDVMQKQLVKSDRSICVLSPRCVISDALTKIAFCNFESAVSLSKSWGSHISLISI